MVLAMAWFVLKDALEKRQKRQSRERRRRETKGKAAQAKRSTEVPP
jgi:hypothetical protein